MASLGERVRSFSMTIPFGIYPYEKRPVSKPSLTGISLRDLEPRRCVK